VARWYTHIKSYASEFGGLPGGSTAGNAFISVSEKPAAAAEEEDDDIDLFGEDDEEEDAEAERIKAERVAAYNAKKANKPKPTAKVSTVLLSPYENVFSRIARIQKIIVMLLTISVT
jgi:elongation factor 1-beta